MKEISFRMSKVFASLVAFTRSRYCRFVIVKFTEKILILVILINGFVSSSELLFQCK